MNVAVGLGGAKKNACVAVSTPDGILGICEQERVTRVKGAGFNSTGLPDEALDELLRRAGRCRSDVTTWAAAECVPGAPRHAPARLDHHYGHACAAFLPSPFESATIIVCDDEAPEISVWDGDGSSVTRIEWPWEGPAFADVYARCADAIGFAGAGRDQRMEALARLNPTAHDDRAQDLFTLDVDRLQFAPDWEARIERWVAGGERSKGTAAASLQARIGDLLVELLGEVKRRAPARRHVCLGGTLFNNSHFNSRVKLSGMFADAFIPINPGNAGLALGAALEVHGGLRRSVTPFLGPSYTCQEIKATLDNCKLNYGWVSEADAVAMAVDDLHEGRLVAWFEGAMEWGPRALGTRSILANPFSEYVLGNLNRFLKQREPWRGYALSAPEEVVARELEGPASSNAMECDYIPRDSATFRHVRPSPDAALRVQTVGSDAPPRFRTLLRAFGEKAGLPFLVNTSFNGFQEPIVCSPRDAVRVFFGSGIDTLVLDRFVIRK